MKVLIIVNPKAGSYHAKYNLLDALNVFSKYGHNVEVYITQGKSDATRKAKKDGSKFDLVVACGGDGTLNEVTNGLMKLKKKPLLGYFPSGTMNDFASNFDLTTDWKKTAERICTGKAHLFDVGCFNNKQYFNYVAAFGAFCDVPYDTSQQKKAALGNLAYFVEGIHRLPTIKGIPVRIRTKDKDEKINAVFGIIFSGYRVAGVEFLKKGTSSMTDGEFNVLIVEYTPNILEVNNYLAVLAKRNSKLYHWYKASEITLEFEDDDVKWTVDGEKGLSKKKNKIVNNHNALKLLA